MRGYITVRLEERSSDIPSQGQAKELLHIDVRHKDRPSATQFRGIVDKGFERLEQRIRAKQPLQVEGMADMNPMEDLYSLLERMRPLISVLSAVSNVRVINQISQPNGTDYCLIGPSCLRKRLRICVICSWGRAIDCIIIVVFISGYNDRHTKRRNLLTWISRTSWKWCGILSTS